jgi:hypothetical protein
MHIPYVSHGGKTIRDVKGIRSRENAFGNTMAGTDDKVIRLQIEFFDGRGKKGKVISIKSRCHRKALNERGLDLHPLDDS